MLYRSDDFVQLHDRLKQNSLQRLTAYIHLSFSIIKKEASRKSTMDERKHGFLDNGKFELYLNVLNYFSFRQKCAMQGSLFYVISGETS